jgi:hypothetical protein
MDLVMTLVVIKDHVLNIKCVKCCGDHAHQILSCCIYVPRVRVIFVHLGLL